MAVNLSVEPFTDRLVKEFTVPTGEVFAEKQTLSQKWGERVQQIDFSKTADELKAIVAAKQNADAAEEDGNSEKVLWPWEDVSQRLRKALTEMSVLSDVLKVVQHQNYLSLAPVVQECPKPPVAVKLKAKRKALACAASVLLTGSEALSTRIQTVGIQSSSVTDTFVSELACLRKRWKVKRIGQTITGSLGYQFGKLQRQVSTQFEIRRVEDSQNPTVSSGDASQLQVIIPRDLQAERHLHMYVSQGSEMQSIGDKRVHCLSSCGYKHPLSSPIWHQKLQQAQDLLASRLAYLLLTHDAFARNSDIQSLTNGNIMHTQLFPDTWLTIACIEKPDPEVSEQKSKVQGLDPMPSLELILCQQLCRLQKQSHSTPPCPVSISSYLTEAKKAMDSAGKGQASSQQLKPSDSLLAHLVVVTRHLTLYGRVCHMVEELSHRIREPVLTLHCGHMCSSMQSVILIKIASATKHQDLVGSLLADMAVSLRLLVAGSGVSAVGSSGQTISVGSNTEKLKRFIVCQVSRHLFNVATAVIRWAGWRTLSESLHTVNDQTSMTNPCPGILVASPCQKWVLSLRFVSEEWPVVKFELSKRSLDCSDVTQNIETSKFLTTDSDEPFAKKLIRLLSRKV